MGFTKQQVGIREGFKSGLEDLISEQIASKGIEVKYEQKVIQYIKKPHKYKPDFELPNGIIIETKGRFKPEDRAKHLAVKKQHPHLDIRFVFTRSKSYLSKTSKTTYAKWCEQKGFQYADKWIPESWFKEKSKRK